MAQIGRWLVPGAMGLAALACRSERRAPGLGSDNVGSAGAAHDGSGGAGGRLGPGNGQGGSALAMGGAAGSAPDAPACTPRQECLHLCNVLGDDPTSCGLGDRRQCGCSCEERFGGPCPDELLALDDCIGDAPSIDCAARGRVFPGCEDESFALEACDFAARDQLCARESPACTPFCRGLRSAFCAHGPESAAACLCGCEATLVSRCATQFDAFMTCTNGAPTFSCDSDGRAVAASCDGAWQALAACMAAPAPGSPDAG